MFLPMCIKNPSSVWIKLQIFIEYLHLETSFWHGLIDCPTTPRQRTPLEYIMPPYSCYPLLQINLVIFALHGVSCSSKLSNSSCAWLALGYLVPVVREMTTSLKPCIWHNLIPAIFNTFDGPGFPACYAVAAVYDPGTIDEAVAIVKNASSYGVPVRASGVG